MSQSDINLILEMKPEGIFLATISLPEENQSPITWSYKDTEWNKLINDVSHFDKSLFELKGKAHPVKRSVGLKVRGLHGDVMGIAYLDLIDGKLTPRKEDATVKGYPMSKPLSGNSFIDRHPNGMLFMPGFPVWDMTVALRKSIMGTSAQLSVHSRVLNDKGETDVAKERKFITHLMAKSQCTGALTGDGAYIEIEKTTNELTMSLSERDANSKETILKDLHQGEIPILPHMELGSSVFKKRFTDAAIISGLADKNNAFDYLPRKGLFSLIPETGLVDYDVSFLKYATQENLTNFMNEMRKQRIEKMSNWLNVGNESVESRISELNGNLDLAMTPIKRLHHIESFLVNEGFEYGDETRKMAQMLSDKLESDLAKCDGTFDPYRSVINELEALVCNQSVEMGENDLLYKEQFGKHFSLGIDLEAFPELVDKSYRHDVAPSFYFKVDEQYYVLWVDYEEKEKREFEEAKRYTITLAYNDDTEESPNIVNESEPAVFETESADEITEKLNDMLNHQQAMTPK